MTNRLKSPAPTYCRIRVKGHLDNKWSDWFDQMAISNVGEETILTGEVADQAALHGLLTRIRDLNLNLLSLECTEREEENEE